MDDNGVRNTLDVLLAGDPDVMDRDQLAGFVTQLGRVRSWCAAAEVRVSRRTRQLAAEGHSESAASLLADAGRCSSKDAQNASERETICGVMPSFEDALAAGAVSAAHVDALAAATRNLNEQLLAEFAACEADLLADAGSQRVEVFERGVVTWPAISPLRQAPTLTSTSWISNARTRVSGSGPTSSTGCVTPCCRWTRCVTPNCGPRSTPNWLRSVKPIRIRLRGSNSKSKRSSPPSPPALPVMPCHGFRRSVC
jgi:hypothetical protein